MDHFDSEFATHREVLEATRQAVREPFGRLATLGGEALARGGKILFCGNGGSAADAQHLAAELVGRYLVNRRALPSIALTTDTSILTAVGNDFGYDEIFVRQVEALGRPGDVLIGISTSGNSRNVLKALTAAKAMGMVAAGLTGGSGGAMVGLADPLIVIPTSYTPRIQEMHIFLGHTLCGLWEKSAL